MPSFGLNRLCDWSTLLSYKPAVRPSYRENMVLVPSHAVAGR